MSLHPVCKQPNSLLRNEIKTNDYLRNENACSVVLMLHNLRIATFALCFLDHRTSISGSSITCNLVGTRIGHRGGKQFVQLYVLAAVHRPSEIVYYF